VGLKRRTAKGALPPLWIHAAEMLTLPLWTLPRLQSLSMIGTSRIKLSGSCGRDAGRRRKLPVAREVSLGQVL
jgi:hypothetical protein